MEEPTLEIHQVKVDDLIPYVNNAKIHDDKQVDTIVASMEEFGNCDPIGVWHNSGGDMEIVEGHGRVLALQKLGIKQAPVIFLDHLTDEQRRAYSHVHNQTTLNSGFDVELLDVDIEQLDYDWEQFGFTPLDDDWETISKEELDTYAQAAEESLKSYNVIVGCETEEEKEFLRDLLGVDRLGRFYTAAQLMEIER